ncbi:hypothetical protein CR513_40342, partial [Mucuna pruriens]
MKSSQHPSEVEVNSEEAKSERLDEVRPLIPVPNWMSIPNWMLTLLWLTPVADSHLSGFVPASKARIHSINSSTSKKRYRTKSNKDKEVVSTRQCRLRKADSMADLKVESTPIQNQIHPHIRRMTPPKQDSSTCRITVFAQARVNAGPWVEYCGRLPRRDCQGEVTTNLYQYERQPYPNRQPYQPNPNHVQHTRPRFGPAGTMPGGTIGRHYKSNVVDRFWKYTLANNFESTRGRSRHHATMKRLKSYHSQTSLSRV